MINLTLGVWINPQHVVSVRILPGNEDSCLVTLVNSEEHLVARPVHEVAQSIHHALN